MEPAATPKPPARYSYASRAYHPGVLAVFLFT